MEQCYKNENNRSPFCTFLYNFKLTVNNRDRFCFSLNTYEDIIYFLIDSDKNTNNRTLALIGYIYTN